MCSEIRENIQCDAFEVINGNAPTFPPLAPPPPGSCFDNPSYRQKDETCFECVDDALALY